MDHFFAARNNMIKGQILPNRITDKAIIDALAEMPRHSFVADEMKEVAYTDKLLPLSEGRYLLPPAAFARMLQEAKIGKHDVVLDIGCGSGYSSAVISHLARKVVAIESDPELASKAHQLLHKLDIGNVIILNSKLKDGHKETAPYNVIFINGAVDHIPHDLIEQLNEGGRLVAVKNTSPYSGSAVMFKRQNDKISRQDLFDIVLPLLPELKENIRNVS